MQADSVAKSSTVKNFQTVYTEVMEITKVFGENLRLFREGLNLSADTFGTKLGVTSKHIYDLERGRKKPSMSLLQSISEKYNADISVLFKTAKEGGVVKTLPMSHSLKMALNIPDEIYEIADKLKDVNHPVWEEIQDMLVAAFHDSDITKRG